jgi:hypothetical protein
MSGAAFLLYPDLRRFALPAQALRAARRAPLDALELLGVAAALIVAMLLARYSAGDLPLGARAATALAVLAATAAPFLVRRTRRGLRRQLEEVAR